MSRWYRFLYRFGITPWEEDTAAVAPQVSRLLDTVEAGREPPFGRALDLGCGSGRWSRLMAQRGWHVTGVDVVPRAVEAARRGSAGSGTDVRFVTGDVTELRALGVEPGVSLVLDVECFNHLDDAQRRRVGAEVDAVATEDAAVVLLTWKPGHRGPLPPGADADDLTRAFPAWEVAHSEPHEGRLPFWLRNADLRWYRLARA